MEDEEGNVYTYHDIGMHYWLYYDTFHFQRDLEKELFTLKEEPFSINYKHSEDFLKALLD